MIGWTFLSDPRESFPKTTTTPVRDHQFFTHTKPFNMITDLWIENFKGIGKRQHIPLRPITLLFGQNSAGKSTVLQSLEYLQSILNTGSGDPLVAASSESVSQLGDFASILHQSATGQAESISLGIRLRPAEKQSWDFHDTLQKFTGISVPLTNETRLFKEVLPFPQQSWPFPKYPTSIDIVVRVSLVSAPQFDSRFDDDSIFEIPVVTKFELTLDGRRFVKSIVLKDGLENLSQATYVSLVHPIWNDCLCQNDSDLVLRFQDPQNDDSIPEADSQNFCVVTNLLEAPEITTGCGDPASLFPDNVEFVRLADFENSLVEQGHLQSTNLRLVSDEHDYIILERPPFEAPGKSYDVDSVRGLLLWGCVEEDYLSEFNDTVDRLRAILLQCRKLKATDKFHERDKCISRSEMSVQDQSLIPRADSIFPSQQKGFQALDSEDLGLAERIVAAIVDFSLRCVRSKLDSMLHLGSKRKTVSRSLTSHMVQQNAGWLDGSVAWTWMLQAESNDIKRISEFLRDTLYLNTGYELRRLIKGQVEFEDSVWANLGGAMTEKHKEHLKVHRMYHCLALFRGDVELHMQDVGEGITQVLPVLAALQKSREMNGAVVAIEQPELHLHPSTAARLGDVVLHTVFRAPN